MFEMPSTKNSSHNVETNQYSEAENKEKGMAYRCKSGSLPMSRHRSARRDHPPFYLNKYFTMPSTIQKPESVPTYAEQKTYSLDPSLAPSLTNRHEELYSKVEAFLDMAVASSSIRTLNFLLSQFLNSDEVDCFSEEAVADTVDSVTSLSLFLVELQEKHSKLLASK
jgi:hypothetical protein